VKAKTATLLDSILYKRQYKKQKVAFRMQALFLWGCATAAYASEVPEVKEGSSQGS